MQKRKIQQSEWMWDQIHEKARANNNINPKMPKSVHKNILVQAT